MNQYNHESQSAVALKKVFFTGSTALVLGQALCYDLDYVTTETGQTAADAWGKRDKAVAVPSNANNTAFAGVVSQAYAAVSGGQWIYIHEPGSACMIVTGTGVTTTISQNAYLTFQVGGTEAGYWIAAGFGGKGTARVLQTISAAGLVLAQLCDGSESGGVEVLTATAGAITCMIGGITKFAAATIAQDATFTLANGTYVGQLKAFQVTGTQTTSNVVITVTAGYDSVAGVADYQETALATLTMDDTGDYTLLIWTGLAWKSLVNIGTVPT